MSYSQNQFPNVRLGTGPFTIAEAGCLLVSDANLLDRFGLPISPVDLNNYFIQHGVYTDVDGDHTMDDLAWGSPSAYNAEVVCTGVGGAGWPDSNDAVIKVVYKSPRNGAMTTHFPLVVDHIAHTILDPWDNKVKVNPYGTPVGWAKYERHQAPVVRPAPQTPAETPSFRIEHITEREMQLKTDTSLWDMTQRSWPGLSSNPVSPASAGARFKTSAIAHHMVGGDYYMPDPNGTGGYNVVDCQDYAAAPDEQPAPAAAPAEPVGPKVWDENIIDGIHYEAEPGNPVSMFVTKQGGANKWNLTGVKSWRDFKSVSHVDYGTEVFVAGIAHHPIPPVGADYYITSDDFGDFKRTGRPSNNYGFNHADLGPTRPPAAEAAKPAEPVAAPAPEPVAAPAPDPAPTTADWRSTYRPFVNSVGEHTPIKYIAVKQITVRPLDGRGPEVPLHIGDLIVIGGTFKGPDGKIRLRPQDAADKLLWHAVPDDGTIEPHDKVMNTQTSPDERRVLGTTTVNDRLVFMADDIDKIFGKLKAVWDIIPHKNKKSTIKK